MDTTKRTHRMTPSARRTGQWYGSLALMVAIVAFACAREKHRRDLIEKVGADIAVIARGSVCDRDIVGPNSGWTFKVSPRLNEVDRTPLFATVGHKLSIKEAGDIVMAAVYQKVVNPGWIGEDGEPRYLVVFPIEAYGYAKGSLSPGTVVFTVNSAYQCAR